MKHILSIMAIILIAGTLKSQTFTMTGSSSTFTNIGKITFTNDDGQFQTDVDSDGNIANSGTISFEGNRGDGIYFSNTLGGDNTGSAGFTSDKRITGWVYFSSNGGDQTVQSRYFTSLGLENAATKVYVSDGTLQPTYVSGTYNVVSGSGTRDYDNNSTTFVYDGDSEQIVFAENIAGTGGRYFNLAFQNDGLKRIAADELVQVQNEVRTETSADNGVTVNGNLWAENDFIIESGAGQFLVDGVADHASLTFGGGTNTIDGVLIIQNSAVGGSAVAYTDAGGEVDINGTLGLNSGTFYVANGTLNLNASSSVTFQSEGYLDVASSQTFYVATDIDNQLVADGTSARNNTVYADDSWAIFDDVDIEETDENFPYGNLEVRATSASVTIEDGGSDRVFLSNNLAVNNNSLNLLPNSSTLTMLDPDATPSYDDATTEVVGMMARRTNGSSNTLTFNNSQMLFAVSSGSGSVSEIALDSRPGNTNSDFDEDKDIRRTVDLYYDATDNFVGQMRYSYLPTEATDLAGTNEQDLRFREDLGSGNTEKVATGFALERDFADAELRWVEIDGIRRAGDGTGQTLLAEVNNPGTLFLRGGPTTFISINSGRWSNPNTWDEGEQPGFRDEAVVRHTVHIGYQRTIDNNSTDENIRLDQQNAGNTMATTGIASRIIIDGAYDDYSTNPSELATLLVGNNVEVRVVEDIVAGGFPDSGKLEMRAKQGPDNDGLITDNTPTGITVTNGNAEYNRGLVVFAGSTFRILNGSVVENTVENEGDIEVGE